MRHRTITAWQETLEGMLLITATATARIGRASLNAMMLKAIADGAGTASLLALPAWSVQRLKTAPAPR
jgi:hypothetical protein